MRILYWVVAFVEDKGEQCTLTEKLVLTHCLFEHKVIWYALDAACELKEIRANCMQVVYCNVLTCIFIYLLFIMLLAAHQRILNSLQAGMHMLKYDEGCLACWEYALTFPFPPVAKTYSCKHFVTWGWQIVGST